MTSNLQYKPSEPKYIYALKRNPRILQSGKGSTKSRSFQVQGSTVASKIKIVLKKIPLAHRSPGNHAKILQGKVGP